MAAYGTLFHFSPAGDIFPAIKHCVDRVERVCSAAPWGASLLYNTSRMAECEALRCLFAHILLAFLGPEEYRAQLVSLSIESALLRIKRSRRLLPSPSGRSVIMFTSSKD